jgi:hypothetical protein
MEGYQQKLGSLYAPLISKHGHWSIKFEGRPYITQHIVTTLTRLRLFGKTTPGGLDCGGATPKDVRAFRGLSKPTFQIAARPVPVIRESAFDVCRPPLRTSFRNGAADYQCDCHQSLRARICDSNCLLTPLPNMVSRDRPSISYAAISPSTIGLPVEARLL